jgi:hypothetical protein
MPDFAVDFADDAVADFYLDAAAFVTRTTNGAAADTEELATNDVMVQQFLFDHTTEEGIQAKVTMPDDWDRGTIKCKVFWDGSAGATAADVVQSGVRASAASNDDAMDAAFGTEVTVNDALIALGDLHVTAATAAITVGGTPLLGDMIWIQVVRKAGAAADTMDAEDAKFLGISVQYGLRAATPAVW